MINLIYTRLALNDYAALTKEEAIVLALMLANLFCKKVGYKKVVDLERLNYFINNYWLKCKNIELLYRAKTIEPLFNDEAITQLINDIIKDVNNE
ncbi:MAG: hypothetical protein ACPG5B_06680 [Chitinophagales bacterium]